MAKNDAERRSDEDAGGDETHSDEQGPGSGSVESGTPTEPLGGQWMRRKRASTRTSNRELRRQRSQARSARKRLFFGLGGGVIAAALITGLVLPSMGQLGTGNASDASTPADTALTGTELPIQAGSIIEIGDEHAGYTTIPPTSGPRYDEPAKWGISLEQLPDESVVRNLEQGGVAINYHLSDPADIALLHDFANSLPGFPGCYVVQPYASLPADSVTVTSWGWTETVTGVDRAVMDQFVASHRNQAPLFLGETCGFDIELPDSGGEVVDSGKGG